MEIFGEIEGAGDFLTNLKAVFLGSGGFFPWGWALVFMALEGLRA